MSDVAPSPGSSSSGRENESDQSDSSNAPPPKGSRSGSSPNRNGSISTSPPSDSQDESSSSSPPQTSPSRSSWNGGNSNSRNNNDDDNDDDNSKSSSPPTRSSPPQQSEGSPSSPPPRSPTPSGGSSSSGEFPARSSTPPPPQWSNNNDQSGSTPPAGGQSSASPPPPPTNHSVVFIPIVSSNNPPGALPPPGLVAIAPPGAIGVMSTHLPAGSTPAHGGATGGMQAGSSGSTPSSSSTQHSPMDSSRSVNGQVAAAIAGASVAGFLFAMIVIFFVASRRRKKADGLVYHQGQDGSYYVHSGQFAGSNPPSGLLYLAPPGAYGPPSAPGPGTSTDNLRGGGGYHQSGSMEHPGSKSSFSYEELTSITSNFSRDNVIGEGGFGCVYKGWLADGRCVAVKQLKAGSGQGEREFQAEVEIISRVHHRHLVSLVGYCVAQHHRMLIYEFVPNGTLEHHLHDRGVPVMDWATRLRIAIGAAKGLAYLHEDCHPRIIHRDIKSANILLDYSFEAQVADFGLAKLSNDSNTHVSTRIMGTFGYLAPEYASSGKLTDRSDVFSFGVVLLELITGRKPVDQTRPLGEESLVEWARPVLAGAVETGDLGELVDQRLEGVYNKAEMARMVEAAAACVRHSAPKRPRMVQVMRALDVDVDQGNMSDLSNGVKVGQSLAYRSDQQEAALEQLRRTAFASEEFTEEYSTDSDTRPMNRRPG